MAASKKHSDDLDLSLTGSQFSSLSSGRRSSSKLSKRPSSASGARAKTPSTSATGLNGYLGSSNNEAHGGARKKHTRSGSHNPQLSNRSDISTATEGDTSSRRIKPRSSASDEFLALFESTQQPKIKKNKPQKTTGAIKANWNDSPLKNGPLPNSFAFPTSARSNSSGNPYSARSIGSLDSSRSKEDKSSPSTKSQAYNIFQTDSVRSSNTFQPDSARSTSTIDTDCLDETEPQLKNGKGLLIDRKPLARPGSLQEVKPLSMNGSVHELFDKSPVERSSQDGLLNSQRPRSPGKLKVNINSTIANNMTSQALTPTTKTSFSDMENSFQNITHKTPVNQVKNTPPAGPVGRNIAENYIKTVNMAATKIQRWYRRNIMRKRAGDAAVKRLLAQKRQEREELAQREEEEAKNTVENAKKRREEKARQARQHAIQELQRKREEKRLDNERLVKEEMAMLEASGRVGKQAGKTNSKKKILTKTRPKSRPPAGSESDSDNTPVKRPGTGSSTGRRVEAIFQESGTITNDLGAVGGAESDHSDEHLNQSSNTLQPSARSLQTESLANTKTTFDDLMSTLKELEAEDKFPSPKNEKKTAWGDGRHSSDSENSGFLSVDKLEKHNATGNLKKSGHLTEDKLRSIFSFLDEVDTADRLSDIDHLSSMQEISRANEALEKPALLLPSGEEIAQMEQASAAAAEVTNTVMAQKMELEEKKRTVTMLQKALNQQRELTVRHAKETEKEMKKRLSLQKEESEETIKRHLSFIDQLIDDKKALSEKCETLVKELKTMDKKYTDKLKAMDENHALELQKVKEIHAAAEKLRREKWIDEKTKKIKEMTVKGLEPEIQRLIAKHKAEMKKIKQIHEAELLESDERAGGRYIRMTEELRDQLAKEKESACQRERQMAKERYEKQLQQEEEAYQQQRRRLYQEIQEEKERISSQASRQRQEIDKLQRQLEDSHSNATEAMKAEYEQAREEQERRHKAEIRDLQERLALEKQSWEENYMKKQENWLLQKERELKEQVRRERDKEIELVIQRLEDDATMARDECERAAENRIKRIREKYDSEMSELDRSERQAMEKYNEMKAKLTEVEGENHRLQVVIKQKDIEIQDAKKLYEKLNSERGQVTDIVRQEFADRIVATDEENKRLKNDMAELKSRHRVELEKAKEEIDLVNKAKEDEMEEVHKRVKAAIVKKEEVVNELRQQYQSALKRADHLEGLLEQQRKQLLGKKK